MPLSRPCLFLIFCLCCLGLGQPLHAERKPPPPVLGAAPPQPVEMNLKVHREGKTEIPLRIYGKAGEPLKYLIRTQPQHGKLSDPVAKEREVAVVIYEPTADLGITTDKFAYAVQSGVGVSAPVEVTITIVDQPPQLQIQDTIDFGTIRAGSTTSRLLELSNQGGMIANGDVIVDAPWKLEGKSGYHLRNGDIAVFKLIFTPELGGKIEGVARYTSDPEHSTTLRGVAEAAITAVPERWVLQQTPGETVRSGAFELTSQLDEARTLELKTDAHLKIPAQVTIPPHGTVSVSVEATADITQPLDTEIRLTAKDFTVSVPVQVPALGAVFRATTPAVAFGRIPAGKEASASFGLENIGGAAGNLSWEISPPFRLSEKGTILQAGEKKEFRIETDGKTGGKFRTWLKIRAGAQSFDIPVEAEIAGGPRPAPVAPAAAPSVPVSGGSPTSSSGESPEQADTAPSHSLPRFVRYDWAPDARLPEGVHVGNITSSSAEIIWPAKLSTATQFRIDMRQLQLDKDGKLQISWVTPTDIPIVTRGSDYVAILKGLRSGTPWTIRVLPMQFAGNAGAPLFTLEFVTPSSHSALANLTHMSPMQWLVLALISLLIWQTWLRFVRRRIV